MGRSLIINVFGQQTRSFFPSRPQSEFRISVGRPVLTNLYKARHSCKAIQFPVWLSVVLHEFSIRIGYEKSKNWVYKMFFLSLRRLKQILKLKHNIINVCELSFLCHCNQWFQFRKNGQKWKKFERKLLLLLIYLLTSTCDINYSE